LPQNLVDISKIRHFDISRRRFRNVVTPFRRNDGFGGGNLPFSIFSLE